MIGFALRNWKLILDCLIVVAAILFFTYWDPFKIFNTAKLRNTATLVTGVREIGELVTAEYYGEVISSWKHYKLTRYAEDSVKTQAEVFYANIRQKLAEKENLTQALNNVASYKRTVTDTVGLAIYNKFIAFLATKYVRRNLKRIYRDEAPAAKFETKMLTRMHDEIMEHKKDLQKKVRRDNTYTADDMIEDMEIYLDSVPSYINDFFPFYSMLVENDANTGANKNKNIVFIGRGWVKAGFRFNQFNQDNFFYDAHDKVVHFYGLEPEILDKDINPWFIPERNVKGFELVNYSGDVSFQDAKIVKKQCKELLLKQAGTEIIRRARENGGEALKSFFGLLLDEPDLKVEFHEVPYQDFYASVSADTLITVDEALQIDSLYQVEDLRISKITLPERHAREAQALRQFLAKCKNMFFITNDHYFNFYSMKAAQLMADGQMSEQDMNTMKGYRGELQGSADSLQLTTPTVTRHALWFSSGDFIAEFNGTADAIARQSNTIDLLHADTAGFYQDPVNKNAWMHNNRPIALLDSVLLERTWKRFFFYTGDLREHLVFPADLKYSLDSTQDSVSLGKPVPVAFNHQMRGVRRVERIIAGVVFRKARQRAKTLAPVKSVTQTINDLKTTIGSK